MISTTTWQSPTQPAWKLRKVAAVHLCHPCRETGGHCRRFQNHGEHRQQRKPCFRFPPRQAGRMDRNAPALRRAKVYAARLSRLLAAGPPERSGALLLVQRPTASNKTVRAQLVTAASVPFEQHSHGRFQPEKSESEAVGARRQMTAPDVPPLRSRSKCAPPCPTRLIFAFFGLTSLTYLQLKKIPDGFSDLYVFPAFNAHLKALKFRERLCLRGPVCLRPKCPRRSLQIHPV